MSTLPEIEAAVERLAPSEQQELLHYLSRRLQAQAGTVAEKAGDLMDLAGTISLREDPVVEQRRLRSEWH